MTSFVKGKEMVFVLLSCLCCHVVGLLTHFVIERARRKTFIEAWKFVNVTKKMEGENKNQVIYLFYQKTTAYVCKKQNKFLIYVLIADNHLNKVVFLKNIFIKKLSNCFIDSTKKRR